MAKAKSICSIDGCGKPVKARGWCFMHYKRWHRHGDAAESIKARTANGECEAWLRDHVGYSGDDCLPWPFGLDYKGYGRSREMCALAHGPAPTPKHQAAHSCGNGTHGCVNPKHLRWATPQENQADRLAHGTHSRGENQVTSKLTAAQVEEIKAALSVRVWGQQRRLAQRYGVTESTGLMYQRHQEAGQ